MNILSISAAAITSAVLALVLKKSNAEYSFILTVVTVCIIGVSLVSEIALTLSGLKDLAVKFDINGKYLRILIKCIGICFLTEFTCDTCKDASQQALSSLVLTAGRVCALVAALPLFEDFIDLSLRLSGGEV